MVSNKDIKCVGILLPLLSNFIIMLNIYNGDLFGIDENIEYCIWFFIPLLINLLYDRKRLRRDDSNDNLLNSSYTVWIIGLLTNIYWYFFSPFKIGGIRHRTEYYDTKCFLCSILYVHLLIIRYMVVDDEVTKLNDMERVLSEI